jgi:uncharacterized protein with HEPN domain
MTAPDKKYLYDIIQAIDLITSFIPEEMTFKDYHSDFKTQSAVERQLAIIGEAINKYEKFLPEHPIQNARQISGMRNRLIHAYDSIDSSIIWAIVKNHLPALKDEVSKKLNS